MNVSIDTAKKQYRILSLTFEELFILQNTIKNIDPDNWSKYMLISSPEQSWYSRMTTAGTTTGTGGYNTGTSTPFNTLITSTIGTSHNINAF